MSVKKEQREQIERFFRKRILQEITNHNPLSSTQLIREAQEEFYLLEIEDAVVLSKILNDVWDLMNYNSIEEKKEKNVTINSKPENYDLKLKVLSYLYDNPYAQPEEISKELNIDMEELEKLFPEREEPVKRRFSPKQKRLIIQSMLDLIAMKADSTPKDLEDMLFDIFQRKVNVRKVLKNLSIELEQKGEKDLAKKIQDFLKTKNKNKDDEER